MKNMTVLWRPTRYLSWVLGQIGTSTILKVELLIMASWLPTLKIPIWFYSNLHGNIFKKKEWCDRHGERIVNHDIVLSTFRRRMDAFWAQLLYCAITCLLYGSWLVMGYVIQPTEYKRTLAKEKTGIGYTLFLVFINLPCIRPYFIGCFMDRSIHLVSRYIQDAMS